MSKTPFSNKVEILGQFWLFYRDDEKAQSDPGWSDFFRWGDVGLPLAYLAWQELAAIKADGKKYIEDAWEVLCTMLNVDPNIKYNTVSDLFDASPNDIVDAEG